MIITPEKFDELVGEAFDALPDDLKDKLNNVAILTDDRPTREQLGSLKKKSEWELLGIYEGHVQSRRINVGPVLPDKITLFRVPIMHSCDSIEECRAQISSTLRHEIAHHLGSDEEGARKAGGN